MPAFAGMTAVGWHDGGELTGLVGVMGGEKGLSLIEVLLSLAVFAFMFVVITQIMEQNYRQGKKMQSDIKQNSRFDNVKDLLRSDLSAVSFFLDVNANFKQNFPLEKQKQSVISQRAGKSFREDSSLRVIFDPHFVFQGTEKELEFVTYSFSEGTEGKQWLKIRYHIGDCPEWEKASDGNCLLRTSREFFGDSAQDIPENQLVILRDFQSVEWAYSQDHQLSKEWKTEWKNNFDSSPALKTLSFPSYVQLKIQRENRENIWTFSVSQSHLLAWSPYAKGWTRWPKVAAPKKTSTNTTSGDGGVGR